MRSLKTTLFLIFLSFNHISAAQNAVYEVTFTGTWSSDDAASFPGTAHFTNLIGATHRAGKAFWATGDFATTGIKQVAETGVTSIFSQELLASRNLGMSGETILFSSLFDLPGELDIQQINVEQDKPFLTLISMIAPSPDWFIGVSDLALQENGQWRENINIELRPYDAGTEDGNGFSLNNPATIPPQAISILEDSPFLGRPSLATLTFKLVAPISEEPINRIILPPITNLLLEDN